MSFWEKASAYCSPDAHRHYFWFYSLSILGGVLFLYKGFIFSDTMLFSRDIMDAGIFFRQYLVDHIRQYGSIPVWNPRMFCGLPYIDAIHGDIFYPLSFLKFIMPIPRAVGWTFILHIYLAGIFAYLAARQLKLSKLAATFAGMAYMFSGWLNSLVYPGHDSKIYVTALLPLLILFLDRAFEKKPVYNYTMAGVVVGFIVLSPHPQMAYFSLWAMAAYILYKVIVGLPPSARTVFVGRHIGFLGYVTVIGLGLGAIQFLPTYHYTCTESARMITQDYYAFSVTWSLHQEELISLIVPEFAGADVGDPDLSYWGRNGMKNNSEGAGLVALLLSGLALYRSRRKDRFFFAILAAGSLVYALGDATPIFKLLYRYVPLVHFTRAPSMIMFIFSLAISMLGAMGIEALLTRRDESSVKYPVLRAIIIFCIPAILLAATMVFFMAGSEMLVQYGRLVYPGLLNDLGKFAVAHKNLAAIRSGLATAFLLSLMVSVIIWLSIEKRLRVLLITLLPLLAMIDGLRFDSRFIKTTDYKERLTALPIVEFLQQHAGVSRTFGFALNEIGLYTHYHGLMSPIGYHGNELKQYSSLLAHGRGLVDNFINPRFTSLVGARYIIMPAGNDLSSFLKYGPNDLVKAAEFGGLMVAENKTCFPRTYLVGQYRVIDRPDSVYKLIYNGEDDLRRIVYLEAEPTASLDSTVAVGDTAEIVYYSPDSIAIRAACSTPKVLIISDNYFRDWHVWVDGQEMPAIRAYAVFRGVHLEAGKHEVVWKYIPRDYYVGRKITLASAGWVLLIGLVSLVRRRKGIPANKKPG